jgi:aldehyde dehydrogenase (NAD+)
LSCVQIYDNYINGQWIKPKSGEYYENINPADSEDIIGRFPLSDTEDVSEAVLSAHEAFKKWSKLLPNEREVYLQKFISLLDKDKHKIGEALCREEGKTLAEALGEPARGVTECSFMLGEGQRMEGITMPSDRHGVVSVARRVPLGVIAAISPWNFPFLTPIRKIIPALAAGNTVVFKPAYDTPHCGTLLMELFHEAGFPKGVINMVIGRGDIIGDSISGNPLVKGITFTGSTKVGSRINQCAAPNFTRVQLEMGGKNPAIIAQYADIEGAAKQLTNAAFAVSGQRCTSISRVIVLRKHEEALISAITTNMKNLVIGNGMTPGVNLGPVVNSSAGEKIMSYIESARKDGACIAVGGHQLIGGIYEKGFYIEPTLITNVTPNMRVAREEIFGPVLVVIPVESFNEAMLVANDSEYGLAAALFSENLTYIYRFLDEMEAGMLHINHGTVTDGNMPFGGVRHSGLGAFSKGVTNKDFFTNLKVTYTKFC